MASSELQTASPRRSPVASKIWLVVVGLLVVLGCVGSHAEEPPTHPSALPLLVPGIYAIDPPHTFVSFAAQHHVVGRVRGRFNRMSGMITVSKDPGACTVDVSIEATSVDTQNGIRNEDLRGADFFDAKKFLLIEYHGRGIRGSGQGWVVDGTLTIRGTAKIVPLEIVFRGMAPPQQGKPSRIAFHAAASVKRADFGMTRELFDEIGQTSTSPDVWIEIDSELLATEQHVR